MKILMLSTDESILQKGSHAQNRMAFYSEAVDELHVVILSAQKYKENRIGDYLWIESTGSKSILWSWWTMYYISRKIHNKHKIQLVTTQDEYTAITGYLLQCIHGVPWQAQIHGDMFSPYYRSQSILHRFRGLLSRLLYGRASCVRVVSEAIAQQLRKRGKVKRITILPVFMEYTPSIYTRSGEVIDPRILVVARLEKEKNVEFAINVFSQIASFIPNSTLVIAGNGREQKKLENIAKRSQSPVQFLGWLNTEELNREYTNASLLFVPSLYESYGRQILEALVRGVPVVTTNVGIASEYIIDDVNGYVIDIGDEAAFIGRMKSIFSIPGKLAQLQNGAQQSSVHLFSKEDYLGHLKRSWEYCITR